MLLIWIQSPSFSDNTHPDFALVSPDGTQVWSGYFNAAGEVQAMLKHETYRDLSPAEPQAYEGGTPLGIVSVSVLPSDHLAPPSPLWITTPPNDETLYTYPPKRFWAWA